MLDIRVIRDSAAPTEPKENIATADTPSDQSFTNVDLNFVCAFVHKKRRLHREKPEAGQKQRHGFQHLRQGEIRVLELYPGSRDEKMGGTLRVVSIDFEYPSVSEQNGINQARQTNHGVNLDSSEPVWYTALSYVWGPHVFDHQIVIDNISFWITGSLASALQQLRSKTNNVREKECQIPLMGAIYSHATNVLIWLGDEGGHADPGLAIEIMQDIHSRLQLVDQETGPGEFERLHLPPSNDRSWWELKRLMSNPWTRRTWTIQEACLANSLFVGYGDVVENWDDMITWFWTLRESGLLKWLRTNEEINRLWAPSTATRVGEGEIVRYIQETRAMKRTRDKVYGLLGLTELTIKPDYSLSKSHLDVFREACVSQMPENTYRILSCIDHDQPLHPSWVPDWSTPRVTQALGYSTKAWTLYHAGGGHLGYRGSSYKSTLSEDGLKLTLSGKIFDTIAAIGCVVDNPVLDIEDPTAKNQAWAGYTELALLARAVARYATISVALYDAFWQTLLAGRDGSGVKKPSRDHEEIFSLILDSSTGQMPSLPGQTYGPRRVKELFTMASLKRRRPAKILADLRVAFEAAMAKRRFAVTTKGYFALVPRGARIGDMVVVFQWACVPFILRESDATYTTGKEGFELLGETYVHGIMGGEIAEDNIGFRDIVLV
ncbi:hypothetical protein BU24DRAFT_429543 [Aaosphaeria arxii CBS 175.79]|uniref:Heterokaryon incompatibility domain-containing protein n=1 Tax=Aaosphaeria arxii CBS 175.79 TaxID=1450172 RepID=A0A6A5Y4F8_9PLEO|nr:uncharacterized protein BU24DRAFT_429543 [Aaosphaeria arxii CBS 175.79]KAF2020388.1 hypothetical protein BU24DRAFT_429543 [Aaosphaeria arxii CBS 175.79]